MKQNYYIFNNGRLRRQENTIFFEKEDGTRNIIPIENTEALYVETRYFIDCVLNNKNPFNDGYAGLRVVKMLEASDKSLKKKGKLIELY